MGQWVLIRIDGREAEISATLDTRDPARPTGLGPCNRWFAAQTAEWPMMALGPIAATRMACPDLEQEQAYFEALSAMRLAAVTPVGTLVLTSEDGRSLEYAPILGDALPG